MSISSETTPSSIHAKTEPAAARSFGRAANWTVGIAAALLVLVSVGGYFYHREQLAAIATEHLRLVVTGPSCLHAGVAAEFMVSTRTISGLALPAQIEATFSGPNGKRLKTYKEPVDEHGCLMVVLPVDLSLPNEITLHVAAVYGDSREEAEISLAVEPIRYATQLTSDKLLYRPGETVHYRSLTLNRFTWAAAPEIPLRFEILAPNGARLPNSLSDCVAKRGVGFGQCVIPSDLADGRYTLIAHGPEGLFPETKLSFELRRADAPSSDKASGGDAGNKVDVKFYPEGGTLAAGIENRVFFVAQDARNQPVNLTGAIMTPVRDARGRETMETIASVKTVYEGMGSFSFIPHANEAYRLKISSPKDVKDAPTLPKASSSCDVVLTAGASVFDAEKPLEFNIRAAKAGRPLIVAAYCRGVQVGQQPLVTQSGANPVTITLDRTIGGIVRLVVYDFGVSPPSQLAERLVYRRPSQKLNIGLDGLKKQYKPGEKVELSLLATNEKGEPARASLGIAAFADDTLNATDNRGAFLSSKFLLTDRIAQSLTDRQTPDFLLSSASRDVNPAAVALDLLLGIQPPTNEPAPPPAMADNLNQIRSDYESSLADYQADRTNALNTLTTASFFGGLGLVLLVAMLGLMRIVAGMHLWIPAIGATTCCLIMGAILMDPGRLATGELTAVSFSLHQAPSSKTAEQSVATKPSLPAKTAGQPASKASVTEKLPLWDPLVTTGTDGKASIRFELPRKAAVYTVTVDAHGAGRLGHSSTEIVVKDVP